MLDNKSLFRNNSIFFFLIHLMIITCQYLLSSQPKSLIFNDYLLWSLSYFSETSFHMETLTGRFLLRNIFSHYTIFITPHTTQYNRLILCIPSRENAIHIKIDALFDIFTQRLIDDIFVRTQFRKKKKWLRRRSHLSRALSPPQLLSRSGSSSRTSLPTCEHWSRMRMIDTCRAWCRR